MNYIKYSKRLFAALIVMIGVFSLGSNTYASLPGCGINSIEPENISIQAGDGDIQIQSCSGIGRSTWNGTVISSARLSPTQSSKLHVSYDKSGGNNQALSDFGKMPGTSQAAGDGVLLKKYDGATLTYYPKAKSTGTPSLQYPSSTLDKIYDKVRYY